MFNRVIKSPTIMTWASFAARLLSLGLPLVFLLPQFSAEQISVWYLFLSLLTVLSLFDMGFGVTFIRNIAYAMAGVENLEEVDKSGLELDNNLIFPTNETLLAKIILTMRFIYNRISLVSIVIMGVLGSLILIKPIGLLHNSSDVWIAWIILLLTNSIVLRGNIFTSYLQGAYKVALFRMWEAIMFLASSITTNLVAIFSPSLLNLIFVMQLWAVLGVARNWYLCRNILNKEFSLIKGNKIDKPIFRFLWPKVWRSGLGVLIARGLVEATGYIYAQIGESKDIAAYLLSLRVIQIISQLSQAPFYSKIPSLAKLYAGGKISELIAYAKTGMRYSYWTYTICFMLIAIIIYPLLDRINSTTEFIDLRIWSIMGLAIILERYGAMHLQLYSITNHILWHIANSITAAIFLLISIFLLPKFGVAAFPLGMLISNFIFYCFFAAFQSYGKFNMGFKDFEMKTSALPIISILIFVIFSY